MTDIVTRPTHTSELSVGDVCCEYSVFTNDHTLYMFCGILTEDKSYRAVWLAFSGGVYVGCLSYSNVVHLCPDFKVKK